VDIVETPRASGRIIFLESLLMRNDLIRWRISVTILSFMLCVGRAHAESLPLVHQIEPQPLLAQVARIADALQTIGAPLEQKQQAELSAARDETNAKKAVERIQKVLDPLCLVGVNINHESRVKIMQGPAKPVLMQQGWRPFLIKVYNEANVTAALTVTTPNAQPMQLKSANTPEPAAAITPADAANRWMEVAMFNHQPLAKTLSGLPLEYRLVEIYARDSGKREAKLVFDVGQGTQDLGFRNEANIVFDCDSAVTVSLAVLDDDKQPTTGQFIITDSFGRICPSQTRRSAPDFFFQPQIYRKNLETISLAPGEYSVTYTRGPEYRVQQRGITVPKDGPHKESFQLERWINLAALGWFSGDHHLHAAGCSHYECPTQGVDPKDIMRQLLGEDLNVGCVLTWGPCWYYQKQFFEGRVSRLSTSANLMRYDVEVSGFPSSPCGHLCLLRLKDDDYPGAKRLEEWPSWNLPILKWAKEQGAVVGFPHSGWGLMVPGTALPSYDMPPFDGIGANEYIVDVVHGACDFISAVDTPITWELSIWYHTLNCGYTTRIAGETDFPCIYDDRAGIGRSYVNLQGRPLTYDDWVYGLRDGSSYVSDGRSHLFDFQINDLPVGKKEGKGRASFLALKKGETAHIRVKAAALLQEKSDERTAAIARTTLDKKPYWHVERSRIPGTRRIPVELIVNGESVERREIEADGSINDVTFEYVPSFSSWIAVRVFAASHTNPIFIEVDGKPIRASKKSADWCMRAVDVCWNAKRNLIRAKENAAAKTAYDAARDAYRRILAESHDEPAR
jgi:hypothetical protein